MRGFGRHNQYPTAQSLGFEFPLSPEQAQELRRAKEAWTDERINRLGASAFRHIKSAETSPISFEGVSVEDLPRPPMPPSEI